MFYLRPVFRKLNEANQGFQSKRSLILGPTPFKWMSKKWNTDPLMEKKSHVENHFFNILLEPENFTNYSLTCKPLQVFQFYVEKTEQINWDSCV